MINLAYNLCPHYPECQKLPVLYTWVFTCHTSSMSRFIVCPSRFLYTFKNIRNYGEVELVQCLLPTPLPKGLSLDLVGQQRSKPEILESVIQEDASSTAGTRRIDMALTDESSSS